MGSLRSRRVRRACNRLHVRRDWVPDLRAHKAEAFAHGHATPDDFMFATADGNQLYFRNVTRDLGTAADRAGLNARYSRTTADVAQLVEHFTRNEGVPGSSPGVGLAEPCGFEHERGPVSGASSRVWAG